MLFKINKDFDVSNSNNQNRNKTNDRKKETIVSKNSKIFNTKIILNVLFVNLKEVDYEEKINDEILSYEPQRKKVWSREDTVKSGKLVFIKDLLFYG